MRLDFSQKYNILVAFIGGAVIGDVIVPGFGGAIVGGLLATVFVILTHKKSQKQYIQI